MNINKHLFVSFFIFCGCFGTVKSLQAATYWASPTGSASWANCKSETPLSGVAACSIATVGSNAAAGDLVYLRGGIYNCDLEVAHSGNCDPNGAISDSCRIVFKGYPADISSGNRAVISNTTRTYATYQIGIVLKARKWIVLDAVDINLAPGSAMLASLSEGAQYNEIKNSIWNGNEMGGIALYSNGAVKSIHNWIHDNTIKRISTNAKALFYPQSDLEAESGWSDYGTPVQNVRSGEQAYAGTYSRKFTVDSGGEGIRSDNFTSTAGTLNYGIAVYPGAGVASIEVTLYKGNGTDIMCTATKTVTPGQWNRVLGNCAYTAGNTGASSYMAVSSPAGVISGTYYIDTFDAVYCNDGSGFQIGSVNSALWHDNNNTIENNYMPYGSHFTLENFTRNNVIRNNAFHNEGWMTKTYECDVCNYGCDSNGLYGNRNLSIYSGGQLGSGFDNFNTSCTGITAYSSAGTPVESKVTNEKAFEIYCSDKFSVDAAGEGIKSPNFTTPPIASGASANLYYEFAVYPSVSSINVRMYAGDGTTVVCDQTKTGLALNQWSMVYGVCAYSSAAAGSAGRIEILSPAGVSSATYYVDNVFVTDGQWTLLEDNRIGFAGASTDDDGSDNVNLTSYYNIFRYNYVYGGMNNNILMKTGTFGGSNRGSHNYVYNNSIYYAARYKNRSPQFQGLNIRWYGSYIYIGNQIINNIIYGYGPNGGGDIGPYSAKIWTFSNISNNWCTASDGRGSCAYWGNPAFSDPDMTDFSNLAKPDLTLQPSSGAIDKGVSLATADGAGADSTSLALAPAAANPYPASMFQDGTRGSILARSSKGLGGTMQADWIAIGTISNYAQISSLDYANNRIILASPMTWSDNAPVWLYKKSDGQRVLYGCAPDYGAHEYAAAADTAAPAAPSGLSVR